MAFEYVACRLLHLKMKCSILIWRSKCSCIISFNTQQIFFFLVAIDRKHSWSYINHFDFVWWVFASHNNGYPCEVLFSLEGEKKPDRRGVGNHEKKIHFMIIERTDCTIDSSYHHFQWSQIYLQFFRIQKCVYMCLRWRCQRTDRIESLKKKYWKLFKETNILCFVWF